MNSTDFDSLVQRLNVAVTEKLEPNADILRRYVQLNEMIQLSNGDFLKSLKNFEDYNQDRINTLLDSLSVSSLVGDTMSVACFITNAGLTKLAAATEGSLLISEVAIGDANGSLYAITGAETALVNEVWRGPASDPQNVAGFVDRLAFTGQVERASGPYTVREIGLFDSDGDLFAVGITAVFDKQDPAVVGNILNLWAYVQLGSEAQKSKFQKRDTDVVDLLVDNQGEWVPGANVKKGQIWSYQGRKWRSLTGADVEPVVGNDWRSLNDHSNLINRDGSGAHPASAICVGDVSVYDELGYIKANSDVINSLSIGAMISDGLSFVTLGDSTEAGIGGAAHTAYAEVNSDLRNGHPNRLAMSLIKSDPNFVSVDPDSPHYSGVISLSSLETFSESLQLTVSKNPTYSTLLRAKSRNSRNKVTVYYNERTSDAAARCDIKIYNSVGVLIAQNKLDSYVPPATYPGVASFDIESRLAKITIDIPSSTRLVRVDIDGLDVIDRGNGVSSDGTVCIYGFTLGEGISFRNLAVSSTTLTEGSSANISRGVDTSERIALAKSLDADLVYIGWGTNDSKDGVTTVGDFKNDYKAIIDDFRAWKPSIKLILGTDPKGLSDPYDNNHIFNEAVREVAHRNSCALFDVEKIFGLCPSGFYSDAVHPSPAGYQALHYALCNFIGVTPFERAINNAANNRRGNRSAVYTIPTSSDFTGNFVEVLNETLTVPSWSKGFIILCDINVARSGADLEECAARLLVNGFVVDRKIVSVSQVNGLAIGQISMNYNADPNTILSSLHIQVEIKNYGIRASDSTSGVRLRFI